MKCDCFWVLRCPISTSSFFTMPWTPPVKSEVRLRDGWPSPVQEILRHRPLHCTGLSAQGTTLWNSCGVHTVMPTLTSWTQPGLQACRALKLTGRAMTTWWQPSVREGDRSLRSISVIYCWVSHFHLHLFRLASLTNWCEDTASLRGVHHHQLFPVPSTNSAFFFPLRPLMPLTSPVVCFLMGFFQSLLEVHLFLWCFWHHISKLIPSCKKA